MSYLDSLPAELRVEIYQQCDYPTKIVWYDFLLLSKAFNTPQPGNRYFNDTEISNIVKYDKPLLIEYYLNKKPNRPYIDNYIHNKTSLFMQACLSKSLNVLKYLIHNHLETIT